MRFRARWPDLYRLRGEAFTKNTPLDGEAPEAALARFERALADCASEDAQVVVTHAGVCRLLYCRLTGLPLDMALSVPLANGSVSLLNASEDGLRLSGWNLTPAPLPTEKECLTLLAGTPPEVRARSLAVAALALELTDALAANGLLLDRGLVLTAARLHDMCRGEPEHARAAERLRKRGFLKLSGAVAQHHDLEGEALDESAVLYLADKCVLGTRRVSIGERFAESAGRCGTEEAMKRHAARLRQAWAVHQAFERRSGCLLSDFLTETTEQ